MKTITSLQNPEIKLIEKLHDSKARKEQGKFLAEGIRVCSTLIASDAKLIQLYITEKMQSYALGFTTEHKVTIVNDQIMKKISNSENPSGILGVFEIPKQKDLNLLTSGIVLAQISDPGNMGTLIRSAAAMGIKTVILIEGADPFNSKVVQSSAGTLLQVNLFRLSWDELIKNKQKLKLCALVVSGGRKPNEINLNETLLVIGNEAHGIPENWQNQCDEKMTLPMIGNVESFNAAIAGSIAMYLLATSK